MADSFGYRIKRWAELYEPAKRMRASGTEQDGPLIFVKLIVDGHAHGQSGGYRDLSSAQGHNGLAAFGLFCKCLELAGNEPREKRDGTIYTHRGARRGQVATDDDIAFYAMCPAKSVHTLMGMLVDVDWVERVSISCAQSGHKMDQAVRTPCPLTKTRTKTETEEEQNLTEQEQERSASVASQGLSVSDFGVRDLAIKINCFLGTSRDPKQQKADATTLMRIVEHVTAGHDHETRKRKAARLLALAKDKGLSTLNNKHAGFAAAVKDEFGDWK